MYVALIMLYACFLLHLTLIVVPLSQDTFSTSLPLAEETAFEEKFKYLIVTSPLLNETLMVQPGGRNKKHQKHAGPHMTTDYSTPTSNNKRFYGAVGVGTMGTLSALLAALGAETLLVQQQQKPASQTSNPSSTPLVTSVIPLTVLLTSSVSAFFVYRHVVCVKAVIGFNPPSNSCPTR